MARHDEPLGVLCLEGEWEPDDPANRQSVRPMMTMLEDLGLIRFFHRDVATYAELQHYLTRWTTDSLGDYRFGYFAFHGGPRELCLNENKKDEHSAVSLETLGGLLAGACRGRAVHFASCSVLDVEGTELADFRKQAGARAVSGYSKDIDWVPSAALELLLITAIAQGSIRRIDVAVDKVRAQNAELMDDLGFKIAAS